MGPSCRKCIEAMDEWTRVTLGLVPDYSSRFFYCNSIWAYKMKKETKNG